MSKEQDALKLALEALRPLNYDQAFSDEIAAIREALADPMQRKLTHFEDKAPAEHRLAEPCQCGKQTVAWCMANTCSKAEQPAQQQEQKLEFVSPGGGYVPAIPRPMPIDWKLVPRKATPEMLKAMDECAQEGYDERLYAGIASSVYMAAWDASPVLGTLPLSEKEISMMDMIVGNLVREGINKHRARELAEHFIKQLNYTNGYCTGRTDLLAEQKAQEPVAWLHTKIEGVAVPHRPADLDRHPDRWTALYPEPKPCPTCESLARTVMMDQTAHDTPPASKPWVEITPEELMGAANQQVVPKAFAAGAAWANAKLREKNA